MNRKNLLAILCVVMLGVQGVYAQCTINTGNTTPGITPTTLPCITQGVAYDQSVQLYVPSSVLVGGNPLPVDSVLIESITGQPSGITYLVNPVSPKAIPGGGNGCINFTGTTAAAVGSYPLTVTVRAWGPFFPSTGQQSTLATLGYNFSFDVCAAPVVETCDTMLNLVAADTIVFYRIPANDGGGYLAGNNGYGDLAKAERFTTTPGYKVDLALFAIGPVTSTNAGTMVSFNVWDNSGPNGAPGTIIATEMVNIVVLDTISAQANPFALIQFDPAPVSTSGTFFVGVTLPTTTGDTVSLYTNTLQASATSNADGWEQWSNGTWFDYDSVWAPHFGHYVEVIACPNVASTDPPAAAFTGTNLTVCGTTTTVAFTDQSTENPTSWAWSFGDGGTSTQQNPSHTYNATGSYNVTLIATNANGSDTLTKNAYVNVKTPVTVSLASTPAGCGQNNGTVTSTAGGGNGTFTYAWSNSATTANLTAVAAGAYAVTVSSNGCTATSSTTVTNSGSTLSADPTSTQASAANATDGTASANATGGTSPYTYVWNNSQTTETITGLAVGTYTVTVTDASGCQDIGSVAVTFGVGISDAKGGFTFSVMPNPASTQIRFEFNTAIQGEGYVFGTDGKLFETFAINNQVETLNISNLPSGVYVVQVKERNSNKASFTRIVKY